MIKYIIIDDDVKIQKKVKDIIRSVSFCTDEEVKTFFYLKYNEELKNEIKNSSERKIYIIDIDLSDTISGIQIAKEIRSYDWDSEIIFMTNHDKMFETVYRNIYKVFDFVEKFYDFEKRIKDDLEKIMKMNFDTKMFIYHGKNIDLHVYYKEILYIYRDKKDRKVIIVTEKNKFLVNLGVQEILKELDDRFKMSHRACIVNIDRVQKFDWKDKSFILDNGVKVDMLSKKYKNNLIK